MKKLLAITLSILMAFSLAACMGNDNTAGDDITSATESVKDDVMSDTTGSDKNDLENSSNMDATNDTADNGLRDGTYKAEGKEYDKDGYKPYVELTVKNGKISEIECDALNKDGKRKREDDNATDWLENMEIFENEVIAKGLDNILIGEDGSVKDIEGLDLNVGEYGDLIKEAMNKAKEA